MGDMGGKGSTRGEGKHTAEGVLSMAIAPSSLGLMRMGTRMTSGLWVGNGRRVDWTETTGRDETREGGEERNKSAHSAPTDEAIREKGTRDRIPGAATAEGRDPFCPE